MYQTADGTDASVPEVSIVVPVHNGAGTLRACLEALLSAPGPARELIVVDDGSRDHSAAIAASLSVRTLQHSHNFGCGAARNSGAKHTTAPILVFVDADVVIHTSALQRISRFMSENPDYSAVFGSYDAEPSDPGFVSQYRNLLHHFTHQKGKCEAKTFWTGLGAVRRKSFHSVGEFNPQCIIGDVAFGLNLSDAGFRIRLDHKLMGKHLKPWTLRTMVRTDVFLRALPFTEIFLSKGRIANDLSTTIMNRLGVLFANATLACTALALVFPLFAILAALTCVATLLANAQILRAFWKERGALFALGVVPLHFVHQLCTAVGCVLGLKRFYFNMWVPSHVAHHSLRFSVGAEGSASGFADDRLYRPRPISAAVGESTKVLTS